jgi:hypothetical protein
MFNNSELLHFFVMIKVYALNRITIAQFTVAQMFNQGTTPKIGCLHFRMCFLVLFFTEKKEQTKIILKIDVPFQSSFLQSKKEK